MAEGWKDIGIKDKMQIVNGTFTVVAAVVLYFVVFFITLTIGAGVVSACGTLLATGLAFFGIATCVKNQLVDFEAEVSAKVKRIEEREERNRATKEEK